jgi:hypothetical protein
MSVEMDNREPPDGGMSFLPPGNPDARIGETIMPARTAVEAFIAHVISGDHVGAIRDWYQEDAWIQENQAPPREGGKASLMKHEGVMMDRTETVTSELLGGPLIDGDQVAIRWRFTFAFKDGGTLRQEEIAWQTWRGDKIATETFFYDPAQRR